MKALLLDWDSVQFNFTISESYSDIAYLRYHRDITLDIDFSFLSQILWSI